MSSRERADTALVSRGFFPSREKAQAAIMAGQVYSGGRRIQKPSEALNPEDELTVRRPAVDYVSRGALKLEKAVRVFDADLRDRVVLDIGASTGGFTDVCLRNGARKVYAVDVGYGQLDWKLRNDPRVTVMERTNARYLKEESFPERPGITVMDVSFISITLILPVVFSVLGEVGRLISLIKPQFEAGRDKIGKHGIVSKPSAHIEVLRRVVDFAPTLGWRVRALDFSPIAGGSGNLEFLADFVPAPRCDRFISPDDIAALVKHAHAAVPLK